MERIIMALILVFSGRMICQNPVADHEWSPPIQVTKAFEKAFPKIEPVWKEVYRGEDKSELNYDANFVVNQKHIKAVYGEFGAFKVLEVEITTTELPAKAQRYLKSNYQNNKINEVVKIMDNNNHVSYEVAIGIEGKWSDAVFDKEGNFLEMRAMN